jgi:hypothetical protein
LIVVQAIRVSFDLFTFYVMIASLLLAAGDVDCLWFCLMGSLLPFSTTSISCARHAPATDFGNICHHPNNLYLTTAYVPFYEDIAMFIILDHPIDYGLNRNRGSTSLGPGGLFVEP